MRVQPTESELLDQGFLPLTGEELKSRISGKQVRGDYLYGYKYIGVFHANGTTEGENNVGSHHFGEYVVNLENNTISLFWDNGWDNTITKAYDIKGELHFFDVGTGNWRMSFVEILEISRGDVEYKD